MLPLFQLVPLLSHSVFMFLGKLSLRACKNHASLLLSSASLAPPLKVDVPIPRLAGLAQTTSDKGSPLFKHH